MDGNNERRLEMTIKSDAVTEIDIYEMAYSKMSDSARQFPEQSDLKTSWWDYLQNVDK